MFIDIFNTDRKYGVIYADPPWTFQTYGEGGKGRSPEKHYPCMTKKEIQELPVPALCEKDCVLFLWVTFPCLLEGLELIKAWGFKYKTCGFVWVKKTENLKVGFGDWVTGQGQTLSFVFWQLGGVQNESRKGYIRWWTKPSWSTAESRMKCLRELLNCAAMSQKLNCLPDERRKDGTAGATR